MFIDGSTNSQLKVGCGAYLVIHQDEASSINHEDKINVKAFENTSSTRLELQTLLWALRALLSKGKKVVVYTDSQNIIGLPSRRILLEQNDYHSGKSRPLNNHDLYREFFKITDQMDCDFVKVKGHQPSRDKEQYDRLFTLVDRASRKALKKLVHK